MDDKQKKKHTPGPQRRANPQRSKGGVHDAQGKAYPIPKGDTPYVQAKKSEYIAKDLSQAAAFYRLAIAQGERPESAVKDLAGVLVQQGKMTEARELLQTHQHLFASDIAKYQNLLTNVCKQTTVTCRYLRLSGLPDNASPQTIRALFSNPNRIHDIEIDKTAGIALLKIMSHSAARKTIESFRARGLYTLEELPSREESSSTFSFSLFSADSSRHCLVPVDAGSEEQEAVSTESDISAVECIGEELYDSIFGTET